MRRAMTIPAVLLAAVTVAATPALAVYPDDQLIAHVRQAVIKHRLVDHPDCVDYVDRQNGQMATDASDPADGGMTMLK